MEPTSPSQDRGDCITNKQTATNKDDVFGTLDHSVLQKPMNLGVKNVQQILQCIQGGSAEVKDVILNECDIVYECKVCRNLFRSLANFLAHKRFYCKEHCCESMLLFPSNFPEDTTTVVQPSSPPHVYSVVNNNEQEESINNKSETVSSIENIPSPKVTPNEEQPKIATPLKENTKAGVEKKFYDSCVEKVQHKRSITQETVVHLKQIKGNSNALFQYIKQNTDKTATNNKDEKVEKEETPTSNRKENIIVVIPEKTAGGLMKLRDRNDDSGSNSSGAVLTREKKLAERNDCDVKTLKCLKCNTQYISLKTLYFHMMSIHAQKRLYYPCSCCTASFVQMWSVTRHLMSVHRKSKEQVSKLKEIIKKRAFLKTIDSDALQTEMPVGKENENKEKTQDGDLSKVIQSSYNKIIKISSNFQFHQCSKCHRIFGRKSSQVSHEKFCIMNTLQSADQPLSVSIPSSSKPVSCELNVTSRPKRIIEKRIHKDFINSQTLRWRSANKVEAKSSKSGKKQSAATIEKKVMAIINAEKLLCLKCRRRFSTFSNLRRHAAIHVGWTRFKCRYCTYQAYNKSDCRSHIQRVHVLSATTNIDKLIVNLPTSGASVKKENVQQMPKTSVGSLPPKPSPEGGSKSPSTKSPTKKDKKEIPAQRSRSSSVESKKAASTVSSSPPSSSGGATIISIRKGLVSSPPIAKPVQVNVSSTARTPRKDGKRSNTIDSLTTLVTRSGAYPKANLIPLRVTSPANAIRKEEVAKTDITVKIPERTYSRKDRQNTDWVQKKVSLNDICAKKVGDSFVVQKSSHPLIIGLVRASSSEPNQKV